MSNSTSHLDPDERLRSLNPVRDQPSDEEIDAALRRLLTRVSTAESSPRSTWQRTIGRRRIAASVAVAFSAAVAAFAAINLLPGSGTPGTVSDAWAKRVIAHAAAAVSGSGSGILHIDRTTTINGTGGPNGPTTETFTVQSWKQETPPYAYWQTDQQGTGGTITTTLSGDTSESYTPTWNSLTEVQDVPPQAQLAQNDPAYQAAAMLAPDLGDGSSSQTPKTFSDVILALLNAPGLTVTPGASINGESAISITGISGHLTLYVQPQTYTPLQLVATSFGTGSRETTITTTFTTYETLPAGSVSMPDLTQLHPNAHVTTTTFGTSN